MLVLLIHVCFLLSPGNHINASSSGLIASWRLDGSDQDILLRGAASYRNEDGVTALYMDGNGSYADTPSLNLFTYPAFTVMFWVKILEPSQSPSHLYSDWSTPHQFAILVLNPSKTVVFKLRDNLGNDLVNCPSEHEIPFDIWLHIAVVWIKERRLAKLLINGTVAGRHKIDDEISNLEVMNNSHGFYQIGKKPDSGKTLHGLVRQLKVFKEELSNRKIKTEMTTFNIIEEVTTATASWPSTSVTGSRNSVPSVCPVISPVIISLGSIVSARRFQATATLTEKAITPTYILTEEATTASTCTPASYSAAGDVSFSSVVEATGSGTRNLATLTKVYLIIFAFCWMRGQHVVVVLVGGLLW